MPTGDCGSVHLQALGRLFMCLKNALLDVDSTGSVVRARGPVGTLTPTGTFALLARRVTGGCRAGAIEGI